MADLARLDELQQKFDENPRRYFAPLANEYRKGGDAERAIELCRTFLPHLPGHMSGYIVYGQALFDTGRRGESESIFQEALRIDPENVIALRHLGDIARLAGDRGVAQKWYERVLDLDPKNEEIAAYVAELVMAGGDEAPVPSVPSVQSIQTEETLGESNMAEQNPEAFEPWPVASGVVDAAGEVEAGVVSDGSGGELDALDVYQTAQDGAGGWIDPAPAPTYEEFVPEPVAESIAEPVAGAESVVASDETNERQLGDVLFDTPVADDLDDDAVEIDVSVPFVTETLANVYIEQGFLSEALAVYRQLAETRNDPYLHDKVAELEERIEREAIAARASYMPSPVASPFPDPSPLTVREFFSAIGATRPVGDDDVQNGAGSSKDEAQPTGLSVLFENTERNEQDERAAHAFADAYAIPFSPRS